MNTVTEPVDALAGLRMVSRDALNGWRSLRFETGYHLFWRGESFDALYLVGSGTLKTYNVDLNGRERVRGFHFPNDLVGLEAIASGDHHCCAMALESTLVYRVPFHELNELMARGTRSSEELFRWISREFLAASQLASDFPADQRIARFLLEMARKVPDPEHPDRVHLIMSRSDIGSYLRMATETVSRNLSRLSRDGLIAIQGRTIDLLEPARLRRLAEPLFSNL